jgi:DNA polymerase III subunit gamma/tau
VQYMPSRGRYKIYLIDEVHMLSAHSFNALLKTLEEPPEHVKFLLATTDPQRLPVTVLSRCLQFNLKRLPVSVIGARLAYILGQEGIAAEPAALRLLATAADGSLRDALSLLDQLLAYGGAGEVREADARNMLGTVDRQQVVQLARLLAAQDMGGLLDLARSLEQWSPDYLQMLDELVSLLARVALFQAVGKPYDEEDDVPASVMAELAAAIAPEDLQLYYQIGLLGRRDLPFSTDQRSGFALILVRMLAFRPGGSGTVVAAQVPGRPAAPASRPALSQAAAAPGVAAPDTSAPVAAASALPLTPQNWAAVVEQLGLSGIARQLAAHCAYAGRQGPQVKLLLDARSQSIRTPANEQKLAAALARHLGEPVRLVIEIAEAAPPDTPARERDRQAEERLASARAALETDPNIKALQSQMGAKIFPESVRPNFSEEN